MVGRLLGWTRDHSPVGQMTTCKMHAEVLHSHLNQGTRVIKCPILTALTLLSVLEVVTT